MPKKKKNHYFTKITEQAIIDYCATEDTSERSDLYIETYPTGL